MLFTKILFIIFQLLARFLAIFFFVCNCEFFFLISLSIYMGIFISVLFFLTVIIHFRSEHIYNFCLTIIFVIQKKLFLKLNLKSFFFTFVIFIKKIMTCFILIIYNFIKHILQKTYCYLYNLYLKILELYYINNVFLIHSVIWVCLFIIIFFNICIFVMQSNLVNELNWTVFADTENNLVLEHFKNKLSEEWYSTSYTNLTPKQKTAIDLLSENSRYVIFLYLAANHIVILHGSSWTESELFTICSKLPTDFLIELGTYCMSHAEYYHSDWIPTADYLSNVKYEAWMQNGPDVSQYRYYGPLIGLVIFSVIALVILWYGGVIIGGINSSLGVDTARRAVPANDQRSWAELGAERDANMGLNERREDFTPPTPPAEPNGRINETEVSRNSSGRFHKKSNNILKDKNNIGDETDVLDEEKNNSYPEWKNNISEVTTEDSNHQFGFSQKELAMDQLEQQYYCSGAIAQQQQNQSINAPTQSSNAAVKPIVSSQSSIIEDPLTSLEKQAEILAARARALGQNYEKLSDDEICSQLNKILEHEASVRQVEMDAQLSELLADSQSVQQSELLRLIKLQQRLATKKPKMPIEEKIRSTVNESSPVSESNSNYNLAEPNLPLEGSQNIPLQSDHIVNIDRSLPVESNLESSGLEPNLPLLPDTSIPLGPPITIPLRSDLVANDRNLSEITNTLVKEPSGGVTDSNMGISRKEGLSQSSSVLSSSSPSASPTKPLTQLPLEQLTPQEIQLRQLVKNIQETTQDFYMPDFDDI